MTAYSSKTIAQLFENFPEVIEPEDADVEGVIPEWLNILLLRNGPGMFTVGKDHYQYWFDGLAYIQKFNFNNGKMKYSARYLQSDTYKMNMHASQIMQNQFGTVAFPDPTKLASLTSVFTEIPILSDNASINFLTVGKTVWAATETPRLCQVDPKTLETLNKVDISTILPINLFTAHQQYDNDGNIYHIGSKFGAPTLYIFAVTKNYEQSSATRTIKNVFSETSIIGSMEATGDPSYNHSFGMTENYFILFETPLRINLWDPAMMKAKGLCFHDRLYWKEGIPVFVRILDKRTGKEVSSAKFRHEPFFSLHQANAFEKEGCIIMDYCTIKRPGTFDQFSLKNLTKNGFQKSDENEIAFCARMIIPVNFDLTKFREGDDLLKEMKFAAKCKAILRENNEIWLEHEILCNIGFEFPRYNMKYNCKPYKYVYGSTILGTKDTFCGLVKLNVESREYKTWGHNHDSQIAAEPIFISSPYVMDDDEDNGIVIATVVNLKESERSYVVILDAKSFTGIARCKIAQRLPLGFHSQFYDNPT